MALQKPQAYHYTLGFRQISKINKNNSKPRSRNYYYETTNSFTFTHLLKIQLHVKGEETLSLNFILHCVALQKPHADHYTLVFQLFPQISKCNKNISRTKNRNYCPKTTPIIVHSTLKETM